MSVIDELKKLAELKRDQLIDEREYEEVKRHIIHDNDSHDSLADRKSVEFYASAVNAWLAYRQETNKQLLLLSSGALALLVNIALNPSNSFQEYGLYFLLVTGCAVAFFICLSSTLLELKYSPSYLKSVIKEEPAECTNKILQALEGISNWAFWFGAGGFCWLVFYKLVR